jgi:hypothetical protein
MKHIKENSCIELQSSSAAMKMRLCYCNKTVGLLHTTAAAPDATGRDVAPAGTECSPSRNNRVDSEHWCFKAVELYNLRKQ